MRYFICRIDHRAALLRVLQKDLSAKRSVVDTSSFHDFAIVSFLMRFTY